MSKVIVVTGAGLGLGRVVAKRLAKDGATLVLLGRTLSKVEVVAKDCGRGALAVQCELTSADSVRAAFAAIAKVHPQIDVLINNAAIHEPSPVAEATDEHIDSHIATNVNGLIYCTRAAIPMLKRGGRIINVSSESYQSRFPLHALYRLSKAAVEEFSSCLVPELEPLGIRVTVIRAGAMRPEPGAVHNVDMKMVMRVQEELRKVGMTFEGLALSDFESAAEVFSNVVNLPADLNVPHINLSAAKPEQV